ncbi:MAG: serine hydrolase domain-containing protein, partial [Hyphomicrobium sp.]
KNLLSMTSSLPNFTRRPPKHLDPWGAIPAQQLLGELKVLQPSGYPGSFEYSNTSYFLLSEILATLQVAGGARSYQGVLSQEIFDKLGLHDTGFATSPILGERLAKPHYNRKPAFGMPDWLQGSADICSTVRDLFMWNKAVMEDRLLSRSMRDAMFSDAARVDVWTYYGMGWFVRHKDGRDEYSHSGSVPGYTALNLIEVHASGGWTSVSILTNSDGVEGLDELASEIAAFTRTP